MWLHRRRTTTAQNRDVQPKHACDARGAAIQPGWSVSKAKVGLLRARSKVGRDPGSPALALVTLLRFV